MLFRSPPLDRSSSSIGPCDWFVLSGRSRHPLLANWVFVIAQSVVGLEENDNVKTVLWRQRHEWQVDARRWFYTLKAPDALPGSIMVHYGGRDG